MTAAVGPREPLAWEGSPRDGSLVVLDQTRLPTEEAFLGLADLDAAIDAIRRLVVRGAPMIGVAGAYAVHLGVRAAPEDPAAFDARLRLVLERVVGARPTAVNLAYAAARVRDAAAAAEGPAAKKAAIFDAAGRLRAEDRAACDAMAARGLALVGDGERLLTYCNTGALATCGVGTALGVVLAAARARRGVEVVACETRPLLQGARLTAWELLRAGVPTTLVCDNAAGELFRRRRIDRVLVGADRIAADGSAANKIGTYGLAVLASAHGVPFHVVAPTSTFDLACPDGSGIVLEERAAEEVTEGFGRRTAPAGVAVFSPAFDVTPARLIASIVTERGIVAPVDAEGVRRLFGPPC